MVVSKLELKCHEYICAVRDIEQYVGLGIYGLDKIRSKIHDEICQLSGLTKDETVQHTDHLDKIKFNGTDLYLGILRDIRAKKAVEASENSTKSHNILNRTEPEKGIK